MTCLYILKWRQINKHWDEKEMEFVSFTLYRKTSLDCLLKSFEYLKLDEKFSTFTLLYLLDCTRLASPERREVHSEHNNGALWSLTFQSYWNRNPAPNTIPGLMELHQQLSTEEENSIIDFWCLQSRKIINGSS